MNPGIKLKKKIELLGIFFCEITNDVKFKLGNCGEL
jgi:hypothetical protein